jgi:hypothetical protein
MPKKTYTQINSVTLAAASATVTFSSIPATMRDLVIVVNGNTSANQFTGLRFNSDSGSNYSMVRMYTGPTSSTDTRTYGLLTTGNPSLTLNSIAQIMDYSATDKHKTVLIRSNIPADNVAAHAVRWANTAAITAVAVEAISTTWAVGTTFNLYGIEA